MKPIIFLDIDGVMNRFPPHPGDGVSFPSTTSTNHGFLDTPCEIIRKLVSDGAFIVLSTSWRHYVNFNELEKSIGIPFGTIISSTPDLDTGRGDEIIAWLDMNHNGDRPPFVVIDDSVEDMPQLIKQKRVVRTKTSVGLQPEHDVMIRQILNLQTKENR